MGAGPQGGGAGGRCGQLHGCRDCEELFAAVAFHRSLISLELVGAPEELLTAAAKAVEHNATLQTLSCQCACPDINDDTGFRLANAPGAAPAISDQTGLALANALRAAPAMRAFHFNAQNTGIGDPTGLALADALRAAPAMLDFQFNAQNTGIGDPTGLALADALGAAPALRDFHFHSCRTSVGEPTGLALADALRAAPALRDFRFYACNTRVGDPTGLALANAMRDSATLEAFEFGVWDHLCKEIDAAVAEAFQCNVALIRCLVSSYAYKQFKQYRDRNLDVRAQRHALTELARCSTDTGFRSLKDAFFRRKVLGYFLPPRCSMVPVEFLRGGMGPAPRTGVAAGAAADAAGPPEGASGGADEDRERGQQRDEGPAEAPQQERASGDVEKESPSEVPQEEELGQAVEDFLAEALRQENADVTEALLCCKIDTPPVSPEDVVVWRLTRRSEEIVGAILRSESLAACRSCVEEAGGEVMPAWARGAILLVPMTAEQAGEGGLDLGAHNVVAFDSNREHLVEALRDVAGAEPHGESGVRSPSRRGAAGAAGAGATAAWPGAAEGSAPRDASELLQELGIVEEHTFLHCPAAALKFELSEASALVQTAAVRPAQRLGRTGRSSPEFTGSVRDGA